jgi:outer membrane receptor for ferrienterochelin and colicins
MDGPNLLQTYMFEWKQNLILSFQDGKALYLAFFATMKRLPPLLIACLFFSCVHAQHIFSCTIMDSSNNQPLAGVSVMLKGTLKGTYTDQEGRATLRNIPEGKQVIIFSYAGFKEQSIEISFPVFGAGPLTKILLEPEEKTGEEVTVYSSRTDSRIENTPTRIEVIGSEEVDEESSVKPANISSLLGDVAGIQTQQTSAVTGNTDIRIQGLPGSYTQLLQDGLPLFGGYAGSFSILHIPPMNIKQIEIIKGASSTLYGGGAIAGMINIISKKPVEGKKERSLLASQSTLNESNVNLYLSERTKKLGYTFFGGGTFQKETDVNNDGFSDVPAQESFFIHPTLYFYPNEKNIISGGISSHYEERTGGDMLVLRRQTDQQHQFFIQNQSYRTTLHFLWENLISTTDRFTFKGTISQFNRNITSNVFGMKARQRSYFTEAAYLKKTGRHDFVMGLNLSGDNFRKRTPDSSQISDYKYFTLGLFAQDDWHIFPKLTAQLGIRSDMNLDYGVFFLPRVSLLYKISGSFTTRVGGGLGYKIPSVFENDLDERDYSKLHLDADVSAEKSSGANWDITYKKKLGTITVTVNQSLFITRINQPLVIVPTGPTISFINVAKPIITKGSETWLMLSGGGLESYFGYTITDARKKYDASRPFLELSARDKFAAIVSYEFSERFRACVEAARIGKQYLEDGSATPSYPLVSGMIRYDIGRLSFVVSCENIFDYRQTKKESIVIPPEIYPAFRKLWAPIDGRSGTLSVKILL